jgi:hypothetical protein
MNKQKAGICNVTVAVVDKNGAPKVANVSITKSPVLLPEFAMSTDAAGLFEFGCELGLYEFTAHADDETSGKVSVTVTGVNDVSARLVLGGAMSENTAYIENPDDPELQSAWATLSKQVGATDGWHYMGSARKSAQWHHHFRSKRKMEDADTAEEFQAARQEIPASPGWQPESFATTKTVRFT